MRATTDAWLYAGAVERKPPVNSSRQYAQKPTPSPLLRKRRRQASPQARQARDLTTAARASPTTNRENAPQTSSESPRLDAIENSLAKISSRVDAADADRSRLAEALTQLTESNRQLSVLIRSLVHGQVNTLASQPQPSLSDPPHIGDQPAAPRHLPIERPSSVAAGPSTPGRPLT